MTPISPLYFGSVSSNNNIVITEEAYKELERIQQITAQTNGEIAFLMFGTEKENGTVWLDTVVSTYNPANVTSANFKELNPTLNKYLDMIKKGEFPEKQIVVHGHSHGRTNVSDNFSFGDLISYVEMTNLDFTFRQREKAETMGVLLAPSGDINFIMYENNPAYEGFYTFPNVYLRHNDGSAKTLPAYQKGNYITKNSLTI